MMFPNEINEKRSGNTVEHAWPRRRARAAPLLSTFRGLSKGRRTGPYRDRILASEASEQVSIGRSRRLELGRDADTGGFAHGSGTPAACAECSSAVPAYAEKHRKAKYTRVIVGNTAVVKNARFCRRRGAWP